jgi:hypothetical protein
MSTGAGGGAMSDAAAGAGTATGAGSVAGTAIGAGLTTGDASGAADAIGAESGVSFPGFDVLRGFTVGGAVRDAATFGSGFVVARGASANAVAPASATVQNPRSHLYAPVDLVTLGRNLLMSDNGCKVGVGYLPVIFAGVIASCADPVSAPPPERAPAPAPAPKGPVRVTARRVVHWSHVQSSDGCFFFSGPSGKDDQLVGEATIERNGGHVGLRIGAALFEGTYREGRLDLMRISPHTYDGPWLALERIHGFYDHGTMTAHYRYNECELARECPGPCTIAGDITFDDQ